MPGVMLVQSEYLRVLGKGIMVKVGGITRFTVSTVFPVTVPVCIS